MSCLLKTTSIIIMYITVVFSELFAVFALSSGVEWTDHEERVGQVVFVPVAFLLCLFVLSCLFKINNKSANNKIKSCPFLMSIKTQSNNLQII